jgi:membrane-bound lytic murein transglycosylase D
VFLSLLSIFAAGCAGLQGNGAGLQASPAEISTSDAAVVAATQEAAASPAQPSAPADPAPASAPVYVSHDLAIESQVAQASAEAMLRELEAEARVVAAIKASFEETRRKHDAWLRLRNGMQLTPVDNARVRAQLKWFKEHPGYMQRVMERARPILPFVLDELEKRDLPTELALLPIVESAYQAFAYSHGRASGMWQIIPSTGRLLGLKQNWWYDGHRDIIESTRAAITYLESLAQMFDGDWELALASYNAGPGRIRSAVRYNRHRDRPTDFWHLTRMRKETLDYVPKLFALKEMFEHPDKYQLDLLPVNNQVAYEIVELDGQIDLALAADLAGISVNQLYQLNPAFNRWATAPEGPHRLLLPRGKADHFRHEVAKIPQTERINWVRHKIKSGDTLSQISDRYGTSVALIKKVNNIRGSNIRAGKYLMIPTSTKALNTYTLSADSRLASLQNTNRGGTKHVHIVRSGQSLWSISRQYGVTTRALAKWNGMAPIDTLQVGQKLVVWSRGQVQNVSINQTRPSNALHALRYTVRKGDSLYRIADRFNISVADIKRWNQVGKYLHPGQKLKLYVDITSQSG